MSRLFFLFLFLPLFCSIDVVRAQGLPVGGYMSVYATDDAIVKKSIKDCFRSEVSLPERCIKVVKVTPFAVRASNGRLYCHYEASPVLNPPLKQGYGNSKLISVCTSRGWADQLRKGSNL